MTANYASVLEQLQSAGLLVDTLNIGRMQRCRTKGSGREKPGWYVLHEVIAQNGEQMLVGSFGIWTGAVNNAQKVLVRKDAFSREQLTSLNNRIKENRKQAARERKRQADRAAQEARKAWIACHPTGDADYLRRKGVAPHGIRFAPSGAVVIPMFDVNNLVHGLQVIRTKKQARDANRPDKEFWPTGVVKQGHFFLIGSPQTVLLIAEGYATGASLHEATGLPVAIAFDAGNLAPVAAALHKRYPRVKILLCADDDAGQKCLACHSRGVLTRVWLPDDPERCPVCDEPHRAKNAGVNNASACAIEVDGAFVWPRFSDESARRQRFLDRGEKLTDYNDLHCASGLHVVRQQIEAKIAELNWRVGLSPARYNTTAGAGRAQLTKIQTTEELLDRFSLVYGQGGMVFDAQEHCLVGLSDMRDLCVARELHRAWTESPEQRVVRMREVGFDPGCDDPEVSCNLWGGWPTDPKPGRCDRLLELLRYMCAEDTRQEELYQWLLKWIAYPIQHPGAKMKTTVVIHGPQGTGKNMFFESYMSIFGPYGRVIDQSAIEDRFNDWASRKLFLIADEVVARSDLFHVKNKLKAFITGDWIRINPKNIGAYDERNHVNLVFLSNETMPVVLEEDDRRHAVIWTPEALKSEFYVEVKAEIDAGGVAALHDYLLNLDLGDFSPATRPPYNRAKDELINLSIDSTTRFYRELIGGEIGQVKAVPALSVDVYELYKSWCHRTGMPRPAPMPKLINALQRRHRVPNDRARWVGTTGGVNGPHGVLRLGGEKCPPDMAEPAWLGKCITAFKNQVNDYKGQSAV